MIQWLADKFGMQDTLHNVAFQDGDSWDVLRGLHFEENKPAVSPASAMRVSAVYACVRMICGVMASMPLHIYARNNAGDKERIQDDLWWLLNEQPCANFTAAAFWEFVTAQVLLKGDGICYIQRDRRGKPIALIPFDRADVFIAKRQKASKAEPDRLLYSFGTGEGYFNADQDDVLHFPGFGFNGEYSMSVIQWGARTATSIAMSADEYAQSYFEKGGQPHHVIKAAGKMTEAQQESFRGAWLGKYGGKKVSGIPLILTEGLEIAELSVSATDAQLLESRKWQVVDIARAFGVPPHMIGETTASTSWGSGIEHMSQGYITFTQTPHMRRFEQEQNRKLFKTGGKSIEFNFNALMRGDQTTRANYFKAALGGTQNPAWMTPNEVRKLENLPAIDGGNKLSKPKDGERNAEIIPANAG